MMARVVRKKLASLEYAIDHTKPRMRKELAPDTVTVGMTEETSASAAPNPGRSEPFRIGVSQFLA